MYNITDDPCLHYTSSKIRSKSLFNTYIILFFIVFTHRDGGVFVTIVPIKYELYEYNLYVCNA